MNLYTIEHNGRRFKVEAENEEQAMGLVASSGQPESLVAGSPEEMRAQRTANLEQSLGLDAPINTEARLPAKDRLWMGAAPTQQEQGAYFDIEYGKGKYIDLGNGRALVKTKDDNGAEQYVLNNPVGLDKGDVVQMSANAPQVIGGIIAGTARTPGPQGMVARALVSSGASAAVSNFIGALQDVGYRAANDTPIDAPEILQRRGGGAALETAVGFGLPIVGSRLRQSAMKSEGINRLLESFKREAKEATANFVKGGINPRMVHELPDAIRASQPTNLTSIEAGNLLADVANQTDKAIQKGSARMLGGAASDVAARSEAQLASATTAPVRSVNEVGHGSIAAAKKYITDAQKAVSEQYNKAYQLISEASGGKPFIIRMNNTDKVVKDILNNRLVDDAGKPIALGTELHKQLLEIETATNALQKLDAVRNLRTDLATHFRGSGVFAGMSEGTAKRLYKSLTEDIDNSVSALSGPGADALRAANKAYSMLVKPVEENSLLGKVVDGAFENGEDVVAAYSRAGTDDWMRLKSIMPTNTYAEFRRAVTDKLIGGSKVTVLGKEYQDIGKLGREVSKMSPEVGTELFGSESAWRGIQQLGREQDYIVSKQGVFASPAMPTKAQLEEVAFTLKNEGYGAANKKLNLALKAQEARTNSLYGSLVSQIKNGSFDTAAKDPEAVVSALLSGKYSAQFVSGLLKKMPADMREQVSRSAFQRAFEQAKDVSSSLVSGGRGIYDHKLLNTVLGNQNSKEAARAMFGEERYRMIEDWAKVALNTQIESQRNKGLAHKFARLVSVLPYGKLLAARATQEAIETAAGKNYLSGLTPDSAALFAETRKSQSLKLSTANTLLQKAASKPFFDSYNQMMLPYSEEQRDQIDAFILGLY